jgi:hypothetical protein
MVRGLCGEEWRPTRVRLLRRTPANPPPYLDLFQSDVPFRADSCTIEFAAALAEASANRSQKVPARFKKRRNSQAPKATESAASSAPSWLEDRLTQITPPRGTLGPPPRAGQTPFRRRPKLQTPRPGFAFSMQKCSGIRIRRCFSRAFSNRFGHRPSRVRKGLAL